MLVDKRLSLLVISAVFLAVVVNLAVNVAQTSIYPKVYQAGRLKTAEKLTTVATPATITVTATKTITTSSAEAKASPAPLMGVEKGGNLSGSMSKVKEQGYSLLFNFAASLAIAASSFMLVKRFCARISLKK